MDYFTTTVEDADRYERRFGECFDPREDGPSQADYEGPTALFVSTVSCGCTHEGNNPACPHGGCDLPF